MATGFRTVARFLILFGILGVFHSAYSAVQHRTYAKLTEQNVANTPIDILVECLTGFIVCTIGVVIISGSFREISATAELNDRPSENFTNRQSFYTFNHRGQILYESYELSDE
ncbi:Membrane magnesium transporter 1-B [Trichoplax sp. H2]|nr:Membrane magnesium transporter 1-B [Trichoplax sp. H2]|eukprot:RDD47655.1 Membrane magnesium transporter 1-B [Trichoplax sp. H2]